MWIRYLVLALVAVAGCGGSAPHGFGALCVRDSDCPSICRGVSGSRDGLCTFPCGRTADCPGGTACSTRGYCLPFCADGQDCPPGWGCSNISVVEGGKTLMCNG